MKTLAKIRARCKRAFFVVRSSPQAGAASGQNDQATAFLTGSPTWDLDAWMPLPRVFPVEISLPAKWRSTLPAIETLIWRVLDCRQSAAAEIRNHENLHPFPQGHVCVAPLSRYVENPPGRARFVSLFLPVFVYPAPFAGGSPAMPPPCGKDVRTRSDCGGGFCPRAVYLYPQITVRRATRARWLLLPLSWGVS